MKHLFVIQVAGNIASQTAIGSLEIVGGQYDLQAGKLTIVA